MATPIEGGEVQDNTPDGGEVPGPNPAWGEVLGVIPEQFHNLVTPHFQQWDQAAQQKIEQANSQVKQFEPYQQFAENGIDAGELEQGLRLMYEINANPQAVYDALANAYNLGGQGVSAEETDDDDSEDEDYDPSDFQDPRFDQLQQGLDTVGQIILQEQNAKMAAQADAELDKQMTQLREKHGDFDERYVLSLMANDTSAEDAIAAYQQLTNNIRQSGPRPFAPSILGSSGGGSGVPSQAIDPVKLGNKETRNLVAQMLEAAAKE